MTSDTLTEKFGAAIAPTYTNPGEVKAKPKSLHKLDITSSSLLKAYLKTASDGLGITKVNHGCLLILWLLDENGEIWFALEEAFKEAPGENLHHPMSRFWPFDPNSNFLKLGHPSLLDRPQKARIGGEIIYDPEFGSHGWVISNKSGRYGSRAKDQPEKHLTEAASVWNAFGISFDIYYIRAVS
ncbi:hypothetical protein [Rhizobium leguminosarum]|uniref:hypothetical protein n=1 Tax=Rhizobium leguminosarum TaxID=384 RepID=UPI001441B440|nr:hypothetical protein [Rhizobium leguminosarum]MBY5819039.1 hypothetical protein [Rhizobium leguminosarum]NKL80165.1 hypothetical protein [Rhizobium leguminosarum bv. viciae]